MGAMATSSCCSFSVNGSEFLCFKICLCIFEFKNDRGVFCALPKGAAADPDAESRRVAPDQPLAAQLFHEKKSRGRRIYGYKFKFIPLISRRYVCIIFFQIQTKNSKKILGPILYFIQKRFVHILVQKMCARFFVVVIHFFFKYASSQ
jgi:hypothetical protein